VEGTSDDVVIDICHQPGIIKIGTAADTMTFNDGPSRFKFACQDIPPELSWLAYDVSVKVIREDNIRVHKRAVSNESAGAVGHSGKFSMGDFKGILKQLLPGETTNPISASEQDVHEKNGVPTTRVVLKFKALRVKHKPQVPQIKTIAGHAVTQIRSVSDPAQPKVVAMFANCPVYFMRSTVEYAVKGYVPSIEETDDPIFCLPAGKTTNL
jgi:hypothetical protein